MKYIFIDTETTGLPKDWNAHISNIDNWPRIVQIAWIITDEFRNVKSEKNYIIYPESFSIPWESSKLHGITDEIAKKSGTELKRVLHELNNQIDDVSYVIGHNIDFDLKVIGAEFFRLNIDTILLGIRRICTMLLSTDYCALPHPYSDLSSKWPTLSELYNKLFNQEIVESHNALIDINATLRCFWELIDSGVIVFRNGEAVSSFMAKLIDRHAYNNKIHERIKSKDFIGAERFVKIWNELTPEWKKLIHEHSRIPLNDAMNQEDALRLDNFFNSHSTFQTGTKITTLEPLKYFVNLEYLYVGTLIEYGGIIGNSNINSIEPICDLIRLKHLDCRYTRISDLSPLSKLINLENLNVTGRNIRSLLPIKDLIKLKKLVVSCGEINDLNPLTNLAKLEDLEITASSSSIVNLDVISKLKNLKHLKLFIPSISDINPLRQNLSLESLFISDTKVSDLEPISNLVNLRVLLISNTNVTSLSPLKNLKELVRVDFDNTLITNIEPLLGLPKLEMIDCHDSTLSQNQIEILKDYFPKARISHYSSQEVKSKSNRHGCVLSMLIIAIIITIFVFNIII